MRTPVAQAGEATRAVADRIRAALLRLGANGLGELIAQIGAEARAAHVVYFHDGAIEIIPILVSPVPVLPDQLSYARTATLTLHRAVKRFPDLYFADPDVRRALELPPAEETWLRTYWTPATREINTMFGRYDAVCDFARPDWTHTLWFLEPNLTGIGGLHLVPSADRVLAHTVLPALHRIDPALQLETAQDVRGLLVQELVDHLQAVGRPARTLCLVEPKYAGSGPDEQAELARYVHDHFAIDVCHADPSELELVGREVCYRGRAIDLAYRDYGVVDLLEAEASGVDIAPMRALFEQNRMVSSIAAELDQKSCFEVLTDPELLARHFDSDERRMFARHVPWTRVLCDRATTLSNGHRGDLLPFVTREREQLVIKPNRSYGGVGVTIGAVLDQRAWEAAIDRAVADSERWVVQAAVPLPVLEFPIATANGELATESYYVVLGFAPSTYGIGVLARASHRRVVNVAQHGGMCVMVIAHTSERLVS